MRRLLPALLALLLAAPLAAAERSDVFDLVLGVRAAELPADFVDHACGTDGGPPSFPLRGFADFMQCPADKDGLREVAFRYSDTAENAARALDQALAVERYAGTRLFDFPVVVSVLFDAAGIARTLRLVTDPRDIDATERVTLWSLGTVLRNRFDPAGWTCSELPLADGEAPVGSFAIKDNCEKRLGAATLVVERRYLRRKGQVAFDAVTGTVIPNAFNSSARFELRLDRASTTRVPFPRG
ncbi:MAG: hypothetical protein U1E56_09155 [Bauldia sp.]